MGVRGREMGKCKGVQVGENALREDVRNTIRGRGGRGRVRLTRKGSKVG